MLVRELEDELADLHGQEAALVFTSGFIANEASLRALGSLLDGCVILSDERNHASMIDGIRASRAERAIFRHNDLEHLRELLEALPPEQPRIVAFESIYSMDGDIAPLREICALAAEHGALTYLDETHAAGAYGREGAGVAQALGAADAVTIMQGSLAKGYGTLGGFIAGPASVIDSVRSHASGFIFTTSLPPAIAAASLASVRHLRASGAERAALTRSVAALRDAFARAGVEAMPSDEPHRPGARARRRALPRGRAAPARRACDLRAADQLPVRAARGKERLRIAPTPAHAPRARRGARRRARRAAPLGHRDLVRTCRMRVSLNHVALSARDLERSTRFYEELFGCERLPVPDVGFPTVWLSLGDRQLHLFERDTAVPPLHHFAVAVDDFGEACRRAEALGAFEGAPYGREAYRLPDGSAAAVPARPRRASRRDRRRARDGRGARGRERRAALVAAAAGGRARARDALPARRPLRARRGRRMTPAAYAVGLARHAADGRLLDAWFPRANVGEHPESGAKIRGAAGVENGSATMLARDRRAAARDDPRHQRRHDPRACCPAVAADGARAAHADRDGDRIARRRARSTRATSTCACTCSRCGASGRTARTSTGIFGLLTNVAWTSAGPVAADELDAGAARGLRARRAAHRPRRRQVPAHGRLRRAARRAHRRRRPRAPRARTSPRARRSCTRASSTSTPARSAPRWSRAASRPGVVIGDGTDVGGGASIMGTLSGGNATVISVGERCLLGANSGLGIPLGDDCTVESGLYLTAGTKVRLPDGAVARARELSGISGMLFRRDSQSGAVEALPRAGRGLARPQRRAARELAADGLGEVAPALEHRARVHLHARRAGAELDQQLIAAARARARGRRTRRTRARRPTPRPSPR